VPTRSAYDWAVVRVVPRVERDEFVNAGVVVFSPARRYLGCAIELPEGKLRALAPDADVVSIRRHLDGFAAVCAGDATAGPIARLSLSERFHWLVAPRNTVLQPSPVHAGLCDDPAAELDRLFRALVLR
jgi:hypothetical protein